MLPQRIPATRPNPTKGLYMSIRVTNEQTGETTTCGDMIDAALEVSQIMKGRDEDASA